MKIQLIDRNEEMCEHWRLQFKNCDDVKIYHGDIFEFKTDCIVSPANSFGFMDGGLDLMILDKIGKHIELKVQQVIKERHLWELLVGQAELISTGFSSIPFIVVAPTMRVPMILDQESVNIYLASRAIFHLIKNTKDIKTISISGLGTGIGGIIPSVCAMQMKKAYHDAWLNWYEFPKNRYDAQTRHHRNLFDF